MVEEKIGIVEHYFTNVNVAAIKINSGELKLGELADSEKLEQPDYAALVHLERPPAATAGIVSGS